MEDEKPVFSGLDTLHKLLENDYHVEKRKTAGNTEATKLRENGRVPATIMYPSGKDHIDLTDHISLKTVGTSSNLFSPPYAAAATSTPQSSTPSLFSPQSMSSVGTIPYGDVSVLSSTPGLLSPVRNIRLGTPTTSVLSVSSPLNASSSLSNASSPPRGQQKNSMFAQVEDTILRSDVSGRSDIIIASEGVQFKTNVVDIGMAMTAAQQQSNHLEEPFSLHSSSSSSSFSMIVDSHHGDKPLLENIRKICSFSLTMVEQNIGLIIGLNNKTSIINVIYDPKYQSTSSPSSQSSETSMSNKLKSVLASTIEEEFAENTSSYLGARDPLNGPGSLPPFNPANEFNVHEWFPHYNPNAPPRSSARSPTSDLFAIIDKVITETKLVKVDIVTPSDALIGQHFTQHHFGPNKIQLSRVKMTIVGKGQRNGGAPLEVVHHLLHIDIRNWQDQNIPSARVKHAIVGQHGFGEFSALMILVNTLIYKYGKGMIPQNDGDVVILLDGQGIENYNDIGSTGRAVATTDSYGRTTTVGPLNRINIHCAGGIGRTGAVLIGIQQFCPLNPAPFSWINMIYDMRKARLDMVNAVSQWKFLQWYFDHFVEDGNAYFREATMASNIKPNQIINFIIGYSVSRQVFLERNAALGVMIRKYLAVLKDFLESNSHSSGGYGLARSSASVSSSDSSAFGSSRQRYPGIDQERIQIARALEFVHASRQQQVSQSNLSPPRSIAPLGLVNLLNEYTWVFQSNNETFVSSLSANAQHQPMHLSMAQAIDSMDKSRASVARSLEILRSSSQSNRLSKRSAAILLENSSSISSPPKFGSISFASSSSSASSPPSSPSSSSSSIKKRARSGSPSSTSAASPSFLRSTTSNIPAPQLATTLFSPPSMMRTTSDTTSATAVLGNQKSIRPPAPSNFSQYRTKSSAAASSSSSGSNASVVSRPRPKPNLNSNTSASGSSAGYKSPSSKSPSRSPFKMTSVQFRRNEEESDSDSDDEQRFSPSKRPSRHR